MCMKNHVIRAKNRNSTLKRINKIKKTRCSLKKKKKKGLHSDSDFILSIKYLLTLSNNGVITLYLF